MNPIPVRVRRGDHPRPPPKRRAFGLDAPLPVDRRIVERALLRHLADERPAVLVLTLRGETTADCRDAKPGPTTTLAAGVPDLMLLAPGGRLVFLTIKTQAETLPRAHRAFADLCRDRGIPVLVVRSLPEARKALDDLAL